MWFKSETKNKMFAKIIPYYALVYLLFAFQVFAAKPNILFILNDDMGYGDPEVYNAESKIPTPEMNRLSQEGIRFTDAHSPYSVCTPTRYGFMTGRYAYRSPLNGGIVWEFGPPAIESSRLTIAEMLQQAGYATALVGKWHLGMTWPTTDGSNPNRTGGQLVDFNADITGGPNDQGFDYYYGVDVPNFPPYVYIENRRTLGVPDTVKPSGMHGYNGVMLTGHDLVQILPNLMNKTIEWMTNQVTNKPDQPFFLFFSNTGPHVPIAPTANFVGTSGAHLYGDFINQIDWVIGQFDSTLINLGVSNNSLIIVTSDNGSRHSDGTNMAGPRGGILNWGHNPSGPLRGTKWDIWEGGHRVPFIAKWPGVIPAGTVSDEIISLTDMFVTFASITNQTVPSTTAHDSYDIMPALIDLPSTQPIREATIAHRGGNFAVRQGPWKYIQGSDQGLYNLEIEIAEVTDVSAQNPQIAQAMDQLATQYKNGERTAPLFVPGSDTRLMQGCMDKKYQEYDPSANIHDITACLTLDVGRIKNGWMQIPFKNKGLEISVFHPGKHLVEIYDLNGIIQISKRGKGPKKYDFSRLDHSEIYLIKVNVTSGSYTKRIFNY